MKKLFILSLLGLAELAVVQSFQLNYHAKSISSAFISTRAVKSPCDRRKNTRLHSEVVRNQNTNENDDNDSNNDGRKKVVIIGAGWGGLSTAYTLATQSKEACDITLIDASPRVGGLVRDGYKSINNTQPAEAGQHGFWDNYHNIFELLKQLGLDTSSSEAGVLTDYAEQGQYSPKGLEAVWPVYREKFPSLPTGLAQASYTKFLNLPLIDRLSAAPLVLAFSEFDDSPEAWDIYDKMSFYDLCTKLGVSKRCYDEAFEPMILTGLFAPGHECSAAAALGMAYFFVLKSQNSFDVRWCRGNIGDLIFQPWVNYMQDVNNTSVYNPVKLLSSTKVVGLEMNNNQCISAVNCLKTATKNEENVDSMISLQADEVVFAVGGTALNAFVKNCPCLSQFSEFRRFANLRGTSVLATRIYLDRFINIPYSANACWGFDSSVGMTMFDISALHGNSATTEGSVIEVDYYHSSSLLVMSDDDIIHKVKNELNTILGSSCIQAEVIDAAIIRLPQSVNWYYPGSYSNMPDMRSSSIRNVYFAGDIVRTRHGSWSQEKAYVTGIEAANAIIKRSIDYGIMPLSNDEPHVAFGRYVVGATKRLILQGNTNKFSYLDFIR